MIKALRKQNGVTLIELLVVVVILGIIAAIAIPAVMNNQKEAYGNTNQQNLQIVQEAVERYAIHNNGSYPVDNSKNTVDFGKLIPKYIKSEPKIYMKDDETATGWPIDSDGKVSLPADAQDGK